MTLKNGKVAGIPFQKAQWAGEAITPEIVVLHDTASSLSKGAAADYLLRNEAKVSVHFVIERDGSIEQQVPVGLRANHAGRSSYHGRTGVNAFSVGIELVNPGRMTRFSGEDAQAWYGKRYNIKQFGIQEITTEEHGHGLWMPHTEDQILALIELLKILFRGVDTLTDITTHWYISPGRKVDTNPLFPLEHIRSLIFGREDPLDDLEDVLSAEVGGDEFVQVEVPGDTLNMRRWPSFNPNIIARIPDGAVLPVVKLGEFDGRKWLKVLYGGQEGWIVARYAAPVIHKEGVKGP